MGARALLSLVLLVVAAALERMGAPTGLDIPVDLEEMDEKHAEIRRQIEEHQRAGARRGGPMATAVTGSGNEPMPDSLPDHSHLAMHLNSVVQKVDENKDGRLSMEELISHLETNIAGMQGNVHEDVLSNEYSQLLEDADSDNSGVVEVGEFKTFVQSGRISAFLAHVMVHHEL